MAFERCPSCMMQIGTDKCPHCGYPDGGQNEAHQLPVGTFLRDRYQIGKVLGQGGFGITYLAWDNLMQKCVAVKEFFPDGAVYRRSEISTRVECVTDRAVPHFEYSRERFLREASALVKFQDLPEIVDILDFVRENNTAYIVMEFVRGLDLKKYIGMKGGFLSVEETFRILKPVMEALAKVHKAGIVHRDISPDNIILDPMGGAKLLDFGAVRAVGDPEVDKVLTKSTEAIIKHGFAPLEQYNTRGSLGPWTDEYAMCATVWYCLTGTVPEEVTIRMVEGTDPDWSSIEGLTEHQQQALAKGMSCRAKDRYKDMDGLMEALFSGTVPEMPQKEIPAGVPASVRKPAEESPAPQPTAKTEAEKPVSTADKGPESAGSEEKKPAPGKKRLWIIAAASVLIVLLAVAVFLPKAPNTAPEEPQPPQLQEETEETAPTTEATEPTAEETEATTEATEPLSEEERQYLQAEQLLEEGKFQEAIDIFTALGDYKDSADRIPECHYLWAEALLAEGKLGEAAIRFGKLAGHADARNRSLAIWDQIAVRDTVAAGYLNTVGLKTDGTLVAVGNYTSGQYDVTGITGAIAVSARYNHTIALKENGTVVAVGSNECGQCDVSEWTDIVAISAGDYHTVGLKSDGTVVAVGRNDSGQCDVSGWNGITAISAGSSYTVGLREDGTLIAVGTDIYGQRNVSGWSGITAVSTRYHTLGLWEDGTVVAVGSNGFGQRDIPNWTDVVAIAAGYTHTVVQFADGTLAAVGAHGYDFGQLHVTGWTDIQLPRERAPFR